MSDEYRPNLFIDWQKDGQPGQFANRVITTFDGAVYTLRFFQLLPPLVVDGERPNNFNSITAKLVATIVVSKDSWPEFSQCLLTVSEEKEPEVGGPTFLDE